MFITMGASLFAYVLTRARLDEAIENVMLNVTGGSVVIFFIIVNIVLLIAGCFLDSTSALYIFTPLFAPVALQLGIDPIHLGVVMIVNLAIGLFTPPVGVNLYVACGIGKISIEEYIERNYTLFSGDAYYPAADHLYPAISLMICVTLIHLYI